MAKPDSKKIFFENLSGAGKAIAVLTSGGDAQGKILTNRISQINMYASSANRPVEGENTCCHPCDSDIWEVNVRNL